MTRTATTLVDQIKDYAQEHYEEGWDSIVEAYDDDEIAELIGKARTLKGAIAKVAEVLDLRAEVRHDVRAAGDIDEPTPEPVVQPKAKKVKISPKVIEQAKGKRVMISHEACAHPRTPAGRAICRSERKAAAAA